jgi:hypothetical protein
MDHAIKTNFLLQLEITKKECCLGTLFTFGEYLGEFQEYSSPVS